MTTARDVLTFVDFCEEASDDPVFLDWLSRHARNLRVRAACREYVREPVFLDWLKRVRAAESKP